MVTNANGSAVIGLLTGAFALLLGVGALATGIAWGAGTFGTGPNWLVAALCVVLGAVALLVGIAGLTFAWRNHRG
jgi:hypothetical protein